MRWTILIVPLLLAGCFDSHSSADQSKRREATGFAAISRFFSFGQAVPDNASEPTANSQNDAAFSSAIQYYPNPSEDDFAVVAAMPSPLGESKFLGESGSEAENPFHAARKLSENRGGSANLGMTAKLIFNTSFSELYSSVFGRSANGNLNLAENEIPNPFTEAKQKEVSAAATKASDDGDGRNPDKASEQDSSGQDQAGSPGSPSAGRAQIPTLIVGDFEGNGALTSRTARDSGDTRFIIQGGELQLKLIINPSAVEQQRSFCIEDINGDSIPDFLATNRMALFGGVFLGTGGGSYRYIDRFLTGYEATIPTVGPFRNGKREILAVDSFSGAVTTFRAAEAYQLVQRDNLPVVPNFLLRLISLNTAREFLMAGKTGGANRLLHWNDRGKLEPATETLQMDPLAVKTQAGPITLQIYQVGSYASIVVSNGRGRSFNVANLRTYPGIFLVIGDLQQQGSIDVAIANLIRFTPTSN